jgi:radical SAM superfamily enzyme YgiQ (UPF0313 family)
LEVKVVLISTYELGRQPFGLASPAAWLRAEGHEVICADLAVGTLPALEVREADVIAIYLPMHTATRLAVPVIERVKQLNPLAHLCCYGLYAPVNEEYLRSLGASTVLGGEFERALVASVRSLAESNGRQQEPVIQLERLEFLRPDRSTLPVLERYPKLVENGTRRRAGHTEASRGCKHLCRHCPVVPVYGGNFRVVQAEVVLDDIRQQVAAGAEHITFGDPDFFNGPAHARRIVEALHSEFPQLTYDVTVKIEHLLEHRPMLGVLKQTGCLFVTSAVESIDDEVLRKLEKGHTRSDFVEVVSLFREHGLTLSPTFIPFTPWTTWAGYAELLDVLLELDLAECVAPVQLTLRLLIPSGSRLLELGDIAEVVTGFDRGALVWRWVHRDPSVDELARSTLEIVHAATKEGKPRAAIFRELWEHVHGRRVAPCYDLMPRVTIPFMEEPWFC